MPSVSPLLYCAARNRFGVVPVEEQNKFNVSIWKQEVYESDELRWKANHPRGDTSGQRLGDDTQQTQYVAM
ncbi:hypothetical protein BDM02DRAFT_3121065 [Thelephora ganbajun]|uniref:Uncharacterized protein n=1 Tax=Thelephora ganbajun TaxID=370292 RepID=A0ACB6Z5X2_THEGA|nr:hypothetical protein BDM02DRAFT_3121065 [Thelephora ganbajun]